MQLLFPRNQHHIFRLYTTNHFKLEFIKRSTSLGKKNINTLVKNMSTTTTTTSPVVTLRPSASRGAADHGWLDTHHTFSFANYHDPRFTSYGPLRVLNEDRVSAANGFPTHPHQQYLIWSYVVSGKLQHTDSLHKGRKETLTRGDVQHTRAGTGVRHSEGNPEAYGGEGNHFIQIWAKSRAPRMAPKYFTRRFEDTSKENALVTVMDDIERVKDSETGAIPLEADLRMEASVLEPGKAVEHAVLPGSDRKVYVHLIMTSGPKQPNAGQGAEIKVGDVTLREGDGAYVNGAAGTLKVESVGIKAAEFLLFDMGDD
jgi:quercetin 2,3-dioxygenase